MRSVHDLQAKALKTMRSMLHLLSAIKESLGAILQVLKTVLAAQLTTACSMLLRFSFRSRQ